MFCLLPIAGLLVEIKRLQRRKVAITQQQGRKCGSVDAAIGKIGWLCLFPAMFLGATEKA
jgi:hypothetical protein